MDKKILGWGIVVLVLVLATVSACFTTAPIPYAEPQPTVDVVDELESRSLSRPVQLRDVRILQDLDVDGDATVGGDATVSDDLTVTDDLAAGGDVTITGGLEVTGGVTGTNVLTTGNQTVAGVKTFTSTVTGTGGATITGAAVNLNASSDFATNINTGTSTGALTLGGGSGTVAVNSSDWDISTAGVMTGIGAVTTDGLATLALGATISGATTSINASSDFATNINTGTSTGALTLGGGSGTVAINSSDWDISTTGAMTGIGAITADGVVAANAGITVDTSAFTVADTSGNVATAGTLATGGAATIGTDLTLTPAAAGGNGALKSELSGLPRVKFAGAGAGTNAALSVVYLDDSPTGECAPVGAAVSEAEGSVGGFFKFGASSYGSTFTAAAVEDDGFLCTISSTDFQTVENFGLWLYPTVTVASGDLQLVTTDAPTGPVKFALGAMTANTWNWVEVDITALDAGTGDAVTGIGVTLTAQGVLATGTTGGAWSLYTDHGVKWLSADSDTLGVAVIQDGVLSVANTTAGVTLAEWTDYFVRYISGNDAIVYMTNQSAATSVVALVAY